MAGVGAFGASFGRAALGAFRTAGFCPPLTMEVYLCGGMAAFLGGPQGPPTGLFAGTAVARVEGQTK